MRLIAFIEYAAVIIGVIAVIAGQFFALPKGFHLGVFLIGAGIALGGLTGIGLGVWEWLEPVAFDRLVGQLQRKLDWPF